MGLKKLIKNLVAVPDRSGEDNEKSVRDVIIQNEDDRRESEKEAKVLKDISEKEN